MESTKGQIVELKQNKVMEYGWGSTDHSCLIAQLTGTQMSKYAELWMGTHPNGPSMLIEGQSFKDYLQKQGVKECPFLFKVLCIEKSLSIQIHPNQQQAQKLHSQNPDIYPDPSDKPEVFYTLTDFECLLGNIDEKELSALSKIAPFSLLKNIHSCSIKAVIAQIDSLSPQLQHNMIDTLLSTAPQISSKRQSLVKRLHHEFPYDTGILVSCLLQYHQLPAGSCFGIAAGVPHAYLKGTCLQIMKNSDNVVRLGLTPKLKDVKTMLEIMDETLGRTGVVVNHGKLGYRWNGLVIKPQKGSENEGVWSIKQLSIVLVVEGQLQCPAWKFSASKGCVFVLMPGIYRFEGKYEAYVGSYEP